jgi:hypothetical protein
VDGVKSSYCCVSHAKAILSVNVMDVSHSFVYCGHICSQSQSYTRRMTNRSAEISTNFNVWKPRFLRLRQFVPPRSTTARAFWPSKPPPSFPQRLKINNHKPTNQSENGFEPTQPSEHCCHPSMNSVPLYSGEAPPYQEVNTAMMMGGTRYSSQNDARGGADVSRTTAPVPRVHPNCSPVLDAAPRHCRMVLTAPNPRDDIPYSSPGVKHFSQRRRHLAAADHSNTIDASSSAAALAVPLVEQVVTLVDRSPTKPERTCSASLSSGRGRGGKPAMRRATSTKEEEKARQFLKEVEDRKALQCFKEPTRGGLAGLPPLPLNDAERTPTSSPRDHRRAEEEVPPSAHLAPTDAEDSGSIGSSDVSFHDDAASSPRSATAPRAFVAAARVDARMVAPLPYPEAAATTTADLRECPPAIRQLMTLSASRYSTRRLPIQGDVPTAAPARVDDDHQQISLCSGPPPRRRPSIRGPSSHRHNHSCHVVPHDDSARTSPPPAASSNRPRMLIQVAPGMQATLRSSDETWEAIKNDFYMPGLCLGCNSTLFVIQDAAYILCPACHTVSPMDGVYVDAVNAGVGLGFKYDDLVRWQAEILREQTTQRRLR